VFVFFWHFDAMNARAFDDVERSQSSGSMLAILVDGQRQCRRLRGWAGRRLDSVSAGAHVWPASALLTVGTLVVAVAWLSHMSVHNASSTYLALTTVTDLHDVVATVQHERRCAVTCTTPAALR